MGKCVTGSRQKTLKLAKPQPQNLRRYNVQKEYSGKPVFGGIAIGRITIYRRKDSVVKREKVTDVEAEVQRYHKARLEGKWEPL